VRRLGSLLVVLGLAAAVMPVQRRVDAARAPLREHHELLYVSSPHMVRILFAGFEDIAADVYWLRAVQYFGSEHAYSERPDFSLLYPLIDITTTLDRRLEIAYRYGAIFLCEPAPMGAGRPQEGIRILEKGIAAMPLNWRLRQDLGFFTFLFLKDAPKAAEILDQASKVPGAAFWLRYMAADILASGGSRDIARRMWRQMYEQSEAPIVRQNAEERLKILDALDAVDAVGARVEEFARRTGRRPDTLEELRRTGLLPVPPVDPSGVPFDYDPATGRVSVSTRSPLWRPDQHAPRPSAPASP
jgi:hypothetical protein